MADSPEAANGVRCGGHELRRLGRSVAVCGSGCAHDAAAPPSLPLSRLSPPSRRGRLELGGSGEVVGCTRQQGAWWAPCLREEALHSHHSGGDEKTQSLLEEAAAGPNPPGVGGVRDKVKMKSSARVFTLDDLLSQKLPFYIARHSNACWQGMNDGSCIWKPLDNSC
jgi:hypothetical protein